MADFSGSLPEIVGFGFIYLFKIVFFEDTKFVCLVMFFLQRGYLDCYAIFYLFVTLLLIIKFLRYNPPVRSVSPQPN